MEIGIDTLVFLLKRILNRNVSAFDLIHMPILTDFSILTDLLQSISSNGTQGIFYIQNLYF